MFSKRTCPEDLLHSFCFRSPPTLTRGWGPCCLENKLWILMLKEELFGHSVCTDKSSFLSFRLKTNKLAGAAKVSCRKLLIFTSKPNHLWIQKEIRRQPQQSAATGQFDVRNPLRWEKKEILGSKTIQLLSFQIRLHELI